MRDPLIRNFPIAALQPSDDLVSGSFIGTDINFLAKQPEVDILIAFDDDSLTMAGECAVTVAFISSFSDSVKYFLKQSSSSLRNEIIDLARGKDVPVIFFNREPVAEDLMQWDRCYYDHYILCLTASSLPSLSIPYLSRQCQKGEVVFFNREPVAEDLMQWDRCYYVGAKAEESGVMQGELAADAILGNEQAAAAH